MTFVKALTLSLLISAAPVAAHCAEAALGFTASQSKTLHEREKAFDTMLDTANMEKWMRLLTAQPHHIGSPYGKKNAEFIAAQFRSWGYDTEIVEYHVLMPTPTLRQLEMTGPTRFRAKLREATLKEDSSAGQDGMLPPYVAFSPDGEATAEVVYVNRGLKEDYEELERRGISAKDKIVLARYGGSWRGIKPKLAEEHGAAGVLLYSDPRDDGYFAGDTYPQGAFKNASGVQRGSIIDLPKRPGDPLTPFRPALADAERLAPDETEVIVGVPTLPISYDDATPILEALGGPVAPEEWRGALPLTYHIGPGPAKVRIEVAFDWSLAPLYNVIARIDGAERPDEWVMRGNHHDAWAHGAEDPVAGLVATMEEARAIGALVKDGWRPKRTIVYGLWDGEEPGLFGSVEWVEEHGAELREKLVAYINTDYNRRGVLQAYGAPTLEAMFNEVVAETPDPVFGASVAERRAARERVDSKDSAALSAGDHFPLQPMGSGSDFSGFIQHLGIAALDMGFTGDSAGGSYHTAYDTYSHFTRFIDPDFTYTRALSQITGRLTMRLADAEVLPFRFSPAAEDIAAYANELSSLIDERRQTALRHNSLLADGSLRLAANPSNGLIEPTALEVPPTLDMGALNQASVRLTKAAATFDEAYRQLEARGFVMAQGNRNDLNALLRSAEQTLLNKEGLPRRPWFRHQIYAPGYYTGYGVKTLPGVREAIEESYWEEAEAQIVILAATLEAFAAHIDEASALIEENQ